MRQRARSCWRASSTTSRRRLRARHDRRVVRAHAEARPERHELAALSFRLLGSSLAAFERSLTVARVASVAQRARDGCAVRCLAKGRGSPALSRRGSRRFRCAVAVELAARRLDRSRVVRPRSRPPPPRIGLGSGVMRGSSAWFALALLAAMPVALRSVARRCGARSLLASAVKSVRDGTPWKSSVPIIALAAPRAARLDGVERARSRKRDAFLPPRIELQNVPSAKDRRTRSKRCSSTLACS